MRLAEILMFFGVGFLIAAAGFRAGQMYMVDRMADLIQHVIDQCDAAPENRMSELVAMVAGKLRTMIEEEL